MVMVHESEHPTKKIKLLQETKTEFFEMVVRGSHIKFPWYGNTIKDSEFSMVVNWTVNTKKCVDASPVVSYVDKLKKR